MILGSIEAGGTKFVCAVGNENYEAIDKAIFPTIDPATTIGNCIAFFKKYPEMQAMSVASFGPIDIDKHSAKYAKDQVVKLRFYRNAETRAGTKPANLLYNRR